MRLRFTTTLLAASLALASLLPAATPPALPTTPAHEKSHPVPIPLWPNGAPGFEAKKSTPESVYWRQEPDIVFPVVSGIHNPSITPYLPSAGKATGAAVIIAPGGGHMFLTSDREGYDLAEILADRGIAAFVLKYRLAKDRSNPAGSPQPYTVDVHALADANRAVRLIRARAAEFGVKPDRIGILGFSAGGEVAILAAAKHDAGQPDAPDPVERQNSRPDFFAPIYPGGLQRTDLVWSKESTPPAFLACSADDRMPDQLAAFFTTLRKAGVNAELHLYNSGGHGFGVRSDRPELAVSTWHLRFVDWLANRGFLK